MKGLRKALLIGMTLGVTVLGTVGCMNQLSNSSNDILKVGAISFAGTLEPTENYFSWAVVRYGVGETLIRHLWNEPLQRVNGQRHSLTTLK